MTDLEEKERAYIEAQITYEKALDDFEKAMEIMPERLACVKARIIRDRAREAFIVKQVAKT